MNRIYIVFCIYLQTSKDQSAFPSRFHFHFHFLSPPLSLSLYIYIYIYISVEFGFVRQTFVYSHYPRLHHSFRLPMHAHIGTYTHADIHVCVWVYVGVVLQTHFILLHIYYIDVSIITWLYYLTQPHTHTHTHIYVYVCVCVCDCVCVCVCVCVCIDNTFYYIYRKK